MATDRWHPPSTAYSDSVRDQPPAVLKPTPVPVTVYSEPVTVPAEYPVSPALNGPDLVSTSRLELTTAALSSSDIPVHPDLLTSRWENSCGLVNNVASSDTSDLSHQLSPSQRKRGKSPSLHRSPVKLCKPTVELLLPATSATDQVLLHPQDRVTPTTSHQESNLDSSSRPKSTRGSRACTVCRRLKMRCVEAENGPPCKRCRSGKHQCIFEESQRGKKGTKRTDLLAKNLQTVEEKLDAVMSQMQSQVEGNLVAPPKHNPVPISPLDYSSQVFRSSTYDDKNIRRETHMKSMSSDQALRLVPPDAVNDPTCPQPTARFAALPDFSLPSSPRLHSLPDNTLNPLGLLAEASLRNRHDRQRSDRSSTSSRQRKSFIHATSATHSGSDFIFPSTKDPQNENTGGHGGPDSSPSPSPSSSGIPQQHEGNDSSRRFAYPPPRSAKAHQRKVGLANHAYFQPGPASALPLRRIVIEQRMPPSLLTDKTLTNKEADELFQIYFEKCNPHCCILEPQVHTPVMVGSRSPFLFTAICAVSSRYYEKRRELHLNCLQAAKRIAFDVMVKGYKSVEVVQAFLLLSLWNQPAERFEEDRTWAFSGIAIRMAIDLNLHRKTTFKLPMAESTNRSLSSPGGALSDEAVNHTQEWYEREILNRERTWLYCFIMDRSLSAQMGKPYSIREDFIIRSSKTWHKHRFSIPDDSGITAMVDLHRIHSRILDTLYSDTCSNSGLNANLDYSLLMKTFSHSLDQWMTECTLRISTSINDRPGGYRHSMKDFYYNYYRLFTMSFMLQHTLENSDKRIELPQVYLTCYDAATRVITIARDHLGPLGALRYAPDNQFVYIAYAAVFLLKLIRPQFQTFCDRSAVRNLVHECTVLLDEVSVDETHTPALYAAFLRVLLNSKKDISTPPFSPGSGESCHPTASVSAPSANPVASNTQMDETFRSAPIEPIFDRTGEGNSTERQLEHVGPMGSNVQVNSPSTCIPPIDNSVENQPLEAFFVAANTSGGDGNNQLNPLNDYFVDSLLKDGGFWDSMLMPGYSGPLDALSAGAGLVSQFGNNAHETVGFNLNTPTVSGRGTPNPLGTTDGVNTAGNTSDPNVSSIPLAHV